MAQEKARALKLSLPLLQEMETSDLVDVLLEERRVFIEEMENRTFPLTPEATRLEIESFDEAVQLVLTEQIELQRTPLEKVLEKAAQPADVHLIDEPEEHQESDDVLDLVNDAFVADRSPISPTVDTVREFEGAFPKIWPKNYPEAEDYSEDHSEDYPEKYSDDLVAHPSYQKAGELAGAESIGGPIGVLVGMLIGLMVLAIYILLPLMAVTLPLVTDAMAWGTLINIGIASGIIAVVIFFCSILNSHRFSYALYAGVVFFALSFGAHNYGPVRNFVEGEKYLLPLVAEQMIEGYFLAAEYTGLPERTGAIPLVPGEPGPGEPRPSLKQRQSAFENEIEGWLEK